MMVIKLKLNLNGAMEMVKLKKMKFYIPVVILRVIQKIFMKLVIKIQNGQKEFVNVQISKKQQLKKIRLAKVFIVNLNMPTAQTVGANILVMIKVNLIT